MSITAFENIINNRRSNRKFDAEIEVPDEIIKKEKIIELNLPHTYDEKNGAQLEEFNFLIPFYIKKLNQDIYKYLFEN